MAQVYRGAPVVLRLGTRALLAQRMLNQGVEDLMETPTWRKICCPVDFSEGSGEALRVAAAMSRLHDATLTVFHVFPQHLDLVAEAYSLTTAEAAERARQLRDNELERWRVRALEQGAPRVETAMATGEPYRAIVDYVAKNHVDLVVMGTHGRTGLRHLVIGSVAERVVRLAPCSVLTCRMTEATRESHRHTRLQPTCGELMRRNVGHVHPHTSLHECARKMADLEAGLMPVVDASGKFLGAVTHRDVMLRLASSANDVVASVSDVMTRTVPTCRASEDAHVVAARLEGRSARRAVALGEAQLVEGVFDRSDLPAQH